MPHTRQRARKSVHPQVKRVFGGSARIRVAVAGGASAGPGRRPSGQPRLEDAWIALIGRLVRAPADAQEPLLHLAEQLR